MRKQRKCRPVIDRLIEKIDRSPWIPGGCWLWTACTNSLGYGHMRVGLKREGTSRMAAAHRLSYELFSGPIPDGLQLDHLCRVPSCVRPSHLEPVTCRENVRRGVGPAAKNYVKTRCPRNHPYSASNTYVDLRGKRECRICRKLSDEKRRRKNRAAKCHPTHIA